MADVAQNSLHLYKRTLHEYIGILKVPTLGPELFLLEQLDWRLHFQRWSVLYVYVFLLKACVLSTETAPGMESEVQKSFGTSLQYLFVLFFNFSIYGVLATHLGWFIVVKSSGCCGNVGYLIVAVAYLATSITHVGYFGLSGFLQVRSPRLLDEVLGLALLVCSIFISLACFKLFEGIPGSSEPLMRPPALDPGNPLAVLQSSRTVLGELPADELMEQGNAFELRPSATSFPAGSDGTTRDQEEETPENTTRLANEAGAGEACIEQPEVTCDKQPEPRTKAGRVDQPDDPDF